MGLWQYLRGRVRIQIISADLPGAMRVTMDAGFMLHNITCVDELTLETTVSSKDLILLEKLLREKGAEVQCVERTGIRFQAAKLAKRPVLIIGIALLIFLSLWLPGKVLFIHISGNELVPDRLILEAAARCGIYFGAERESVRSERMKNALLEAMPELQWAGINTSGCVAVITVREREAEPEQNNKEHTVSSIVAARDGIIDSITAEKGTALCKPGQSVAQGQKLISGYTDCGISIRAEAAQGEVYALTEYKLTVCAPADRQIQRTKIESRKKYSVKIGKKRINFYKGSGISPATCDRIYEENYITLPGGFILPVSVVAEQYIYYHCDDGVCSVSDTSLSEFAESYLLSQMIGGQILSSEISGQTSSSLLLLEGVYRCREMIGRVVKEEIVKPDEYDK